MSNRNRHFRDKPNRISVIDDEKNQALFMADFKWTPPQTDILSPPYDCYKINIDWQPLVLGFVSHLNTVAVWEDATEDDYIGIEQINKFLAQVSDCMRLRQNPNNLCQLEQSLDGGDTWTLAFDYSLCLTKVDSQSELISGADALNALIAQYDGTVASVAPDMVYDATATDDIRDLALCHATSELINMLCELELDYRESINIVGDVMLVVATLIGIAVTVFSLGSATPLYMAVSLAIGGAVANIFDLVSDAVLSDQDARDQVICCMTNALEGSTITKLDFESSLSSCGFAGGSNADQIAGAISNWLTDDNVYESFLDAMQESYKFAELGLVSCVCDASWTWSSDFANSQSIWVPRVGNYDTHATYSTGVGFVTKDAQTGVASYSRLININTSTFDTDIDSIVLDYDMVKGAVSQGTLNSVMIRAELDDTTLITESLTFNDVSNGPGQTLTLDLSAYDNIVEIVVLVRCSTEATVQQLTGSCALNSIQVIGTGINPF